jgi:hypothetical protein
MRLIHRHRSHRPKTPRISLTQEEISADLHYPAGRQPSRTATAIRVRGAGR